MGLDVTATHVVWAVAFTAIAGGAMGAFFDNAETLADAQVVRARFERERTLGAIGSSQASWDEATRVTTITAWNTGHVAFRLDEVDVLVNGDLQVGATAVVSGASEVWAPDEMATWTLADQDAPGRIVLVTERGLVHYVWPPRYIQSIVVAPASADVQAGGTQDFTATAYDFDGLVMNDVEFTWTATAGSIAPLLQDTARFTAPTLAQNGVTITASAGGKSGTATVNVVPGPVATVEVLPATATVLTGATQSFTAAAYDQHGNAVGGATFAWTVARGTLSGSGASVTYTAPSTTGADTVTATAEGVSDSASIQVTKNVRVAAMATYNGAALDSNFKRGETVTTKVTIRDHANALVQGATVTIRITDNNGVVQHTGSATTDASGVATIAYTIPNGASRGMWTDATTGVSGSGLTWVSANDVQNPITFEVSNTG